MSLLDRGGSGDEGQVGAKCEMGNRFGGMLARPPLV